MPTLEEVVTVNLESTSALLGECIAVLRGLDGVRVPMGNNARRADVRKDLAYLADTLARASAEARAVYHTVNGKPDILETTR